MNNGLFSRNNEDDDDDTWAFKNKLAVLLIACDWCKLLQKTSSSHVSLQGLPASLTEGPCEYVCGRLGVCTLLRHRTKRRLLHAIRIPKGSKEEEEEGLSLLLLLLLYKSSKEWVPSKVEVGAQFGPNARPLLSQGIWMAFALVWKKRSRAFFFFLSPRVVFWTANDGRDRRWDWKQQENAMESLSRAKLLLKREEGRGGKGNRVAPESSQKRRGFLFSLFPFPGRWKKGPKLTQQAMNAPVYNDFAGSLGSRDKTVVEGRRVHGSMVYLFSGLWTQPTGREGMVQKMEIEAACEVELVNPLKRIFNGSFFRKKSSGIPLSTISETCSLSLFLQSLYSDLEKKTRE